MSTYDSPDPISKPKWLSWGDHLDVTLLRVVVLSEVIFSEGHRLNFEAYDAFVAFEGSVGVDSDVQVVEDDNHIGG
jgi:hypothetical protein